MLRFWSKVFLVVLIPFISNYSQKSSDLTVLITANLTKEQGMELPGNLNFDQIDLANSSSVISRTPNKGIKIKIVGRPDKKIVLKYSSIDINNFQWASQNEGEKGTISFTPNIECTFSSPSYSKPLSLKSGSSYSLPNFDGNGLLYIWIGGKIKIDDNQPPGNYAGILQIKISYE
jgi:hypothetical protein